MSLGPLKKFVNHWTNTTKFFPIKSLFSKKEQNGRKAIIIGENISKSLELFFSLTPKVNYLTEFLTILSRQTKKKYFFTHFLHS